MRMDVHKPSVIVPTDYKFVGLTTAHWAYGAWPTLMLVERAKVLTHMAETKGNWSGHNHKGNCDSCGAHCVRMAVFHHPKSNTYIRTGLDCAEKMGIGDPNRFRNFMDIVKAALHHKAGKKKANGLLVEAGLVEAWDLYKAQVEMPEIEDGFVASILEDPKDEFRRLVFGDWLEEQGRVDQANLIRHGHPVEKVGLPMPTGVKGEIIRSVMGVVKYGKLGDYWKMRLKSLLDTFHGKLPEPEKSKVNLLQASMEKEESGKAHWALWLKLRTEKELPYEERVLVDMVNGAVAKNWSSLTISQTSYAKVLQKKITERIPKLAPNPVRSGINKVTDDLTATLELFKKAKEHLTWPKIHLQFTDLCPLVLSIAGPKSKFKGQIMLTDGGKFGANKWFGRITPEGTYAEGKATHPEILSLLRKFAANPVKVAADYGKLTGNCCFCHKELSDARSTAVGYGGTCAKNWGMPWGEKVPLKAQLS